MSSYMHWNMLGHERPCGKARVGTKGFTRVKVRVRHCTKKHEIVDVVKLEEENK